MKQALTYKYFDGCMDFSSKSKAIPQHLCAYGIAKIIGFLSEHFKSVFHRHNQRKNL